MIAEDKEELSPPRPLVARGAEDTMASRNLEEIFDLEISELTNDMSVDEYHFDTSVFVRAAIRPAARLRESFITREPPPKPTPMASTGVLNIESDARRASANFLRVVRRETKTDDR